MLADESSSRSSSSLLSSSSSLPLLLELSDVDLSPRPQLPVADDDTAAALGSGDLPVLGTPRLLAWCEATTCAALDEELTGAETSVGTQVTVTHRRPSPVGEEVTVTAQVSAREGARVTFTVAATDSGGAEVAGGEVTRAVVERERFLARL